MVGKTIINGEWVFWWYERWMFKGLPKSTLLQVTLIFQHTTKVNSSDNNVEYTTSKIVYITSSNMNSSQN
jgi:hypothetical protein